MSGEEREREGREGGGWKEGQECIVSFCSPFVPSCCAVLCRNAAGGGRGKVLRGPGVNGGAAVVLCDAECCALEIPALERYVDELACACLCVCVCVRVYICFSSLYIKTQ